MTPAGPPLHGFLVYSILMVEESTYFAKPCAKTLSYISPTALEETFELRSYIRKASHVMTTVQLKPRMDMKPKFRCHRYQENK